MVDFISFNSTFSINFMVSSGNLLISESTTYCNVILFIYLVLFFCTVELDNNLLCAIFKFGYLAFILNTVLL